MGARKGHIKWCFASQFSLYSASIRISKYTKQIIRKFLRKKPNQNKTKRKENIQMYEKTTNDTRISLLAEPAAAE